MLRFSKASIELYERTGRDRGEGNLLWGANGRARSLQRKIATRLSNSKAGYYLQSAVADYSEDSRFSAISSILVTEFQLRPVPGVFRVL